MSEKKPARILVLERDREFADFIAETLKPIQAELDFCEEGKKALQRLLKGSYDLVLTEIVLPGLDGLNLLKILRTKGIEIPVVFLTTVPQKALVMEAKKWKVTDFILKPIEEKRLLRVVRSVLFRSGS